MGGSAGGDLSNALDWDNVVEEIESVGRSQVDVAESLLIQMLVHVLKYMSASSARSSLSWRTEVLAFQAAFRRRYKSSMERKIDWNDLWASSLKQADSFLRMFGDRLVLGLPTAMPFTPDELTAADFDMDRALERLAATLENPTKRQ